MSVDLLYVAHNRREFCQATFPALVENTNWELVDRLFVCDDRSEDGTAGYLASEVSEFYARTGMTSDFVTERFGGPVNAMNWALDRSEAKVLAKVDNDCVVCPGWLDTMAATLEAHPRLDALGMEPGFGGDPAPPSGVPRAVEPAKWIGGIGLIRTRAFAHTRPRQGKRYFGWTEHQRRYCRSGWITPALPVFLLDHLPFEPWLSLTGRYIAEGWQRPLRREAYDASMAPFWSWWTREREAVA